MSADSGIRSDSATGPKSTITPPGSLTLPPSPPYTGEKSRSSSLFKHSGLLPRLLHELDAKQIGGESRRFRLSPGAYTAAEKRLEKSDPSFWGAVLDKTRCDLIDDNLLVLRMSTTVHELIAQKLSDAIKDGLKSISSLSNRPTKRLIENIDCAASANVYFTETWWRSPDQQFKVKTLHFPGVVVEVAYSQAEKDIARVAKEYIRESYGRVQVVVSIKVDPRAPGIKLSMWRPKFEHEGDLTWVAYDKAIDDAELQDREGNTFSGDLVLRIQDFAPRADLDRLYGGAQLDKEITIPYRDIVDFVQVAKVEQTTAKLIPVPLPNMRKRPRSESPTEELDSTDEREYKRRETVASNKAMAQDDDYRA